MPTLPHKTTAPFLLCSYSNNYRKTDLLIRPNPEWFIRKTLWRVAYITSKIGSGSKGREKLNSLLWLNNFAITAKAIISFAMVKLAMANNVSFATIAAKAAEKIRNLSAIANKKKLPSCEPTRNAAACVA